MNALLSPPARASAPTARKAGSRPAAEAMLKRLNVLGRPRGFEHVRVFELDASWTAAAAEATARSYASRQSETRLATDLVLARNGDRLIAVYGADLRELSLGDRLIDGLKGEVVAVIRGPGSASGWLRSAQAGRSMGMNRGELEFARSVIAAADQWPILRRRATDPDVEFSGPHTREGIATLDVDAANVPGSTSPRIAVTVLADPAGVRAVRLAGRGPAVFVRSGDAQVPKEVFELGAQLLEVGRSREGMQSMRIVSRLHELLAPPEAKRS